MSTRSGRSSRGRDQGLLTARCGADDDEAGRLLDHRRHGAAVGVLVVHHEHTYVVHPTILAAAGPAPQGVDRTFGRVLPATGWGMSTDSLTRPGAEPVGSLDDYVERMRSWLEQGRYQAALAASDGETVAYVVWREDPDYDDVFVRQFFVVREHGGHGLGHQLFEEAAAEFWPGRLLRLDVNDSNPGGGRFWESLGFAPFSRLMRREPTENIRPSAEQRGVEEADDALLVLLRVAWRDRGRASRPVSSQIEEFGPASRWYVGFIRSTALSFNTQMKNAGRGAICGTRSVSLGGGVALPKAATAAVLTVMQRQGDGELRSRRTPPAPRRGSACRRPPRPRRPAGRPAPRPAA